jgi:hypothetical protein
MAKFIMLLTLINQLFPLVIGLIRGAEEAIPGQGAGEQKLAMVRGMLESAFAVTGKAEASFTEIWPVVQSMVTGAVAALNATGWRR